MNKIYDVTEFAEMIGKSVKTLQRWDREGILEAYRSPTNRRYYTQAQYNKYMGFEESAIKANVIYARASTKNQKDDLENQIRFLQKFTMDNGIPISNIIFDYGSGLNYNRKNWNHLIEQCFNDEISTIIISHKDRFMRFGFEWFSSLLERLCGVKIVVVENIATTPQAELINDLISIIHIFSCRVYRLRKYKKKIESEVSYESKKD